MLSGTAEYALRAVVHIARYGRGRAMKSAELSEATEIPKNYLSKILMDLARAHVLRSTRGRNGGFALARDPSQLRLADVVAPFSDVEGRRCLMGRPECSSADPCPVHHRWLTASQHIADFFAATTLADVLNDPAADLAGVPVAQVLPDSSD
jgi:Rrf2 family protein